MSKTVPTVHTVLDLRKALRKSFKTITFPELTDLDAWDQILKLVGRERGEDLTEDSFRRLEIRVAEKLDKRVCDLSARTLSEFVNLCSKALGYPRGKWGTRRRRRGRPTACDPNHDAQLAIAWCACGCRTYIQGVEFLRSRFPDLTERKLRDAVDRHRHRVRRKPFG